jgi:cell division control protein 6
MKRPSSPIQSFLLFFNFLVTPKKNRHEMTPLSRAKALFRPCSTPTRLVGRQMEREAIESFWNRHAMKGIPGSLYISGCPGSGKTALLNEFVSQTKPPKVIF